MRIIVKGGFSRGKGYEEKKDHTSITTNTRKLRLIWGGCRMRGKWALSRQGWSGQCIP